MPDWWSQVTILTWWNAKWRDSDINTIFWLYHLSSYGNRILKGIEKSSIQSLALTKDSRLCVGRFGRCCFTGAIIGVTLLVGDISFTAVNKNINWGYTIALL